MKNFIFIIIMAVMLVGCGKGTPEKEAYRKISAEDAKKMMDENEDIIILDVRTEEEYSQGHIESSLLIPDTEIEDKAEEVLTDKDAVILIYCRSGRRSETATKELIEMGYTKTFDFGGINDWPYETVE
ncbi:MAG: rhodanese-like domain-containing protein [Anaerotignaceae bacterium]